MEALVELEERGWRALSTGQVGARAFYSSLLSHDVVMVFPGGLRLSGKENVLASIGAQPWNSYQLTDVQVLSLSKSGALVIYRVTAQREGGEPYGALASSLYVERQGRWVLAFHQQTPI